MDRANITTHASQPAQVTPAQQSAHAIDVKQLAERVYQLMLADLRLERARGVPITRRQAR